jgi:hypothetical protein
VTRQKAQIPVTAGANLAIFGSFPTVFWSFILFESLKRASDGKIFCRQPDFRNFFWISKEIWRIFLKSVPLHRQTLNIINEIKERIRL